MDKLDPENTTVLLLGVSQYKNPVYPDLPSVKRNLERLEDVFSNSFGIKDIQVYRDPSTDNKREILQEITDFNKSENRKTILFYYSGHGEFQKDDDDRYLVLRKSKRDELVDTCISISEISKRITKDKKQLILILDCCNAGADFIFSKKVDVLVLSASYSKQSAKAPEDLKYTAFTGELIDILENGLEDAKEYLTFHEIAVGMHKRLIAKNYPKPDYSDKHVIELEFVKNNFDPRKQASPPRMIYNCLTRLNLIKPKEQLKKFLTSKDKSIGYFFIDGKEVTDIEWLYNLFLNQYISKVKLLICPSKKKWERIQDTLFDEFGCETIESLIDSVIKKLEVSHVVFQIPCSLSIAKEKDNTVLGLLYENFLLPLSQKMRPDRNNKLLLFLLQDTTKGEESVNGILQKLFSDLTIFSINAFTADHLFAWFTEQDAGENYYTSKLFIPKDIEETLRQKDSVEEWKTYMETEGIYSEKSFDGRIYSLMKKFQLDKYYREIETQCLRYKI